jgi:hypothetical protein
LIRNDMRLGGRKIVQYYVHIYYYFWAIHFINGTIAGGTLATTRLPLCRISSGLERRLCYRGTQSSVRECSLGQCQESVSSPLWRCPPPLMLLSVSPYNASCHLPAPSKRPWGKPRTITSAFHFCSSCRWDIQIFLRTAWYGEHRQP